MKRIFLLSLVIFSIAFSSCSDESIELNSNPQTTSPSNGGGGGGEDDDDPIPPGGVRNPEEHI